MKNRFTLPAIFLSFLIAAPFVNGQEKLKAEEVIQKHLLSIAPADKLSSIKSLIAERNGAPAWFVKMGRRANFRNVALRQAREAAHVSCHGELTLACGR